MTPGALAERTSLAVSRRMVQEIASAMAETGPAT